MTSWQLRHIIYVSMPTLVALPILIPLTGAMIALLLRGGPPLQAGWALGTMLTSLAVSVWLLLRCRRAASRWYSRSGGWPRALRDLAGGRYAGGLTFVVMTQLVMVSGIIYAMGSKDKVVTYPTFFPLFLTLATGLTGRVPDRRPVQYVCLCRTAGHFRHGVNGHFGRRVRHGGGLQIFLHQPVGLIFHAAGHGQPVRLLRHAEHGRPGRAHRRRRDAARCCGRPSPSCSLPSWSRAPSSPFISGSRIFTPPRRPPVSAMLSSVVVKLGVYGFLRMTTLLFVAQARPAARPS